jgi:hypothetical protein
MTSFLNREVLVMLTGYKLIFFNRKALIEMIQQKQYAKVQKVVSYYRSMNAIQGLEADTEILYGITLVLETKIANKGMEHITRALKKIPIEIKMYIYQDIDKLLFKRLFIEKAYQIVIDCSVLFLKEAPAISDHDPVDMDFLSKLYTVQGQAYNKLKRPDLAKENITLSISILQRKKMLFPLAPKLEAMRLKDAKPEAVKLEVMELDDAKPEAVKLEVVELDDAKPEAVKLEVVELDDAKPEAVKLEVVELDDAKPEAVKLEVVELDDAKPEAMKLESIKLGNRKTETVKLEAMKVREKTKNKIYCVSRYPIKCKKKPVSKHSTISYAAKQQLKKIKKERSIQNQLHEQAVTISKQMIKQIIDQSIKIGEEKSILQQKKLMLEEAEKKHLIEDHRHEQAVSLSKQAMSHIIDKSMQLQLQLQDSVMARSEFDSLCALEEKISKTGATFRVIGSSGLVYHLAKNKYDGHCIVNNDIDIQIRNISEKNKHTIINILSKEKFSISKVPKTLEYRQYKEYRQHKKKSDKLFDLTLVLDEKIYNITYNPIDITCCGLIINRNSGRPVFELDENKKILDDAFRNGYFNVDLSKGMENVTNLFVRMIKSYRKCKGLLFMRVIVPGGASFIMDEKWRHPFWISWLKQYFDSSFINKKTDSLFRWISQLILSSYSNGSESYLNGPESKWIIYTFCESYLHSVFPGPHFLPIAIKNMYNLVYGFYEAYYAPIQSVTYSILQMLKTNNNLWSRAPSVLELQKDIRYIAYATQAYRTPISIIKQHGMYQTKNPIYHAVAEQQPPKLSR